MSETERGDALIRLRNRDSLYKIVTQTVQYGEANKITREVGGWIDAVLSNTDTREACSYCGSNTPGLAGLIAERDAARAELAALRQRMTALCTCPASSMFEGPSKTCVTHGLAGAAPAERGTP